MSTFPDAQPHGPIEKLGDDVFWVQGTMRMAPGLRISRNMVIIRSGEELTLVTAVRLSEKGERELEALGKVTNVVKIGAAHDYDDPYCVWRFGARYWALPHAAKPDGPTPDAELSASNSPVTDCAVFQFAGTKRPEAALLIQRGGGILVTCDAVQNWPNTNRCSLPAKLVCKIFGFTSRPAQIGPPWRKVMTPRGGSLRGEFERLAALEFTDLIGGHGAPLRGTAKAALQATIAATYD